MPKYNIINLPKARGIMVRPTMREYSTLPGLLSLSEDTFTTVCYIASN
jgi:hypothetical protein